MKKLKTTKALRLSKKTIATLSNGALGAVVGGRKKETISKCLADDCDLP